MGVIATNLLGGAGELYRGDFGATEPLDTALTAELDDVVWTDFGGTDGGVTKNVDRNYYDLRADQIMDPAGTRQTSRTITLATNLAEITLENLATAWGQDIGDITTGGAGGTAWRAIEPQGDDSGEEPPYHALVFRGWAPGRKRRLVIARKVLSVNAVGTAYKKDEQTFIPVQFKCFYVSPTVRPIRVVEQAVAA